MKPLAAEPVLSAAALSGILIGLASHFHIVLDAGLTETLLAALLPVALSFLARARVSPAKPAKR
jgi:hypothetical protein